MWWTTCYSWNFDQSGISWTQDIWYLPRINRYCNVISMYLFLGRKAPRRLNRSVTTNRNAANVPVNALLWPTRPSTLPGMFPLDVVMKLTPWMISGRSRSRGSNPLFFAFVLMPPKVQRIPRRIRRSKNGIRWNQNPWASNLIAERITQKFQGRGLEIKRNYGVPRFYRMYHHRTRMIGISLIDKELSLTVGWGNVGSGFRDPYSSGSSCWWWC